MWVRLLKGLRRLIKVTDFMGEWLVNWVALVERHAKKVVFGLLMLGLLGVYVSVQYSKINSDLSTLIRPSSDLTWYQHNESYKESFPDLQQLSLIHI